MSAPATQRPGTLLLSNIRFSYLYCFAPFLAKPSPQQPNPKPTYTAHGLFDAKHPDVPKLVSTIDAVAKACWGEKPTEYTDEATGQRAVLPAYKLMLASIRAQDKLCLHRGDVSKMGAAEYAGLLYVSSSRDASKGRITILDRDRSPLTQADGRPYSGCYGNMMIDIWAQNNSWGKRINATLTGVQFTRDGEAFGGGAAAASPDEFPVEAQQADAAPPGAAAADPLAGIL